MKFPKNCAWCVNSTIETDWDGDLVLCHEDPVTACMVLLRGSQDEDVEDCFELDPRLKEFLESKGVEI